MDHLITNLEQRDPEVAEAIVNEARRQHTHLELIASENFVSEAVLQAMGSVFTNKYAEGYPGKRYYGGCEFVDRVETLAIERAKKLFNADHANVQPNAGSPANMAIYLTALQHGDKVLGMNLSHGGHLTHGHHLNFSGKMFQILAYGVERDSETIDYNQLRQIAERERPKMIITGASAYSRIIDFKRVGEIARSVGAVHMADIAHIAGMVATGLHPSPVPHAEFVTSTTHKTLRGPRGGFILCKQSWAKDLDRTVFPGIQGGPLVHMIAAKAVCFLEALQPEFKIYQQQVVRNADALARTIAAQGFRIVSGGTDNHLFVVDVFARGITGKQAEEALDRANITVNKNTIPFETNPPFIASGIRIGSPAVTTRGMREAEMEQIGEWIGYVLQEIEDQSRQKGVKEKVLQLIERFPLYLSRQRIATPL
ncbi:MAG: serine hydroxymethyltransferase [Acidobacteria bacterium]|nr:serine hydroxymethyltransferase [Acidobacteriota bacterium]